VLGGRISIAASTLLCLAATTARATNWVINPTGVGDDFPNIQTAINSASVVAGDYILLKDGTYTGAGNRDVNFQGKNVTVKSQNGNPLNCVIDCQGSFSTPHRAFLFVNGETSAMLHSIKIVNGGTAYGVGAAVYASGASPYLYNCIFQSCRAEGADGGAVYLESSPFAVIEACQFVSNACGGLPPGRGGAVFSDANSTPMITGSSFTGNLASNTQSSNFAAGGAIYCANALIQYCTVNSNTANGPGGGVYAVGGTLSNCTLNGNAANNYGAGGGAYLVNVSTSDSQFKANRGIGGGGIYATGGSITKCVITGNLSTGDAGGGVFGYGVSIQLCTLSGNAAPIGGGLNAANCPVSGTILWGNCAAQGSEIAGDATVTLTCCCTSPSGVSGAVGFSGPQVTTNPIFCGPLACTSAPSTGGIFTLAYSSPCLPGGNACAQTIGALGAGCNAAAVPAANDSPLDFTVPSIVRGEVEIRWRLPREAAIDLSVHDVQGRMVASLARALATGSAESSLRWSGRNDRGARLPRGIYYLRLACSAGSVTRRVIVLGD